ncbi:hypothetical protein LVJ94_38515 [Pendulispora rubella]|uniref:Uncharacterized protein n=1 Tax=Pendulispora rubella TaxID=2741070 RepID=A0ABZ2KVT1_9BACT
MRRSVSAIAALLALAALAAFPAHAAEDTVRFDEVVARMRDTIDRTDHAAWRPAFEAMCQRHGLDPNSAELFRDFVRLQSVFEATRDGGMWRVRWAVTNREPTSKAIWQSWQKETPPLQGAPSVTAECDEISALTAFLATKLEVRGVGLFWPTWNHTIAAWEPRPLLASAKDPARRKKPRILLPTTQVFQGCDDALDHTTFDPSHQGAVFEYTLLDVRPGTRMASSLATFLVEQLEAYNGASLDLLALLRLHRGKLLRSSVGDCADQRSRLAASISITAANERALTRYFAMELARSAGNAREMLAELAR